MSEEIKNGFEKLDDAVLEEVNGGRLTDEKKIENYLQRLQKALNSKDMPRAESLIADLRALKASMTSGQSMVFETLQSAYRNLKNA